jgi:hypothetical protein
MKLIMTRDLPNKVGFYWYCNFGEHTPVVLEVTRDYSTKKLWASNEEFGFQIKKVNLIKNAKQCRELEMEKKDGFWYGEELWCYIPNPFLPGGEIQVEPDSY